MTYPISQNAYSIGGGTTSTNSLLTAFFPRDPTPQDVNFQATQRWINTSTNAEWCLIGFISSGGVMVGNWQEISRGAAASLNTLTGTAGGAISGDSNGNINLLGTNVSITGNPTTHSLTFASGAGGPFVSSLSDGQSPTPSVAYPTSGGNIQLADGTNISTIATTNTVTINLSGEVAVANGGTGNASFTAYSVLCGGTTSTGALQNVSGVGSSGQILTSNGAGMLPTCQNNSFTSFAVNQQVKTTTGTYTPTSGMAYCIIEVLGGGGAGGGATTTSSSQFSVGAAGGAGEHAKAVFSKATIGASQSVTIGAGGTGSSGMAGGNGGTTSVGSLISADGGTGGGIINATGSVMGTSGGAGGTGGASTGVQGAEVRTPGGPGGFALTVYNALTGFSIASGGTNSQYGSGGANSYSNSGQGGNASGYGASGAGSANATSAMSALAGGNGSPGVVIITEFIT